MDLWIRSQDRENIIQTNKVGYLENSLGEEILNYVITANDIWVGGYATKERALEVLDEIQNILKPRIITKFINGLKYDENKEITTTYMPYEAYEKTDIQELTTYIYEMPKE